MAETAKPQKKKKKKSNSPSAKSTAGTQADFTVGPPPSKVEPPTATVVLSGGAPNSPLMAGALAAVYDLKKTFNVFYTSGAGAGIGLLFLASKDKTPTAAMKAVLEAGVDDRIYERFPIGYKAFFKHSPFSAMFRRWGELFKIPAEKNVFDRTREFQRAFWDFWRFGDVWDDLRWWDDYRRSDDDSPRESFRRFYNDAVDLWTAAATPTTQTFGSLGLCAPFPFVEEFISFDKLKKFKGRFYMNTYCVNTGKMEQFDKNEIRAPHFRAALAFPFIYPPSEIDGKLYFEGSTMDPLNLPKLAEILKDEQHTVVLLDVLGALKDSLVRKPRNIIDAYGISIMTPIVSLAEKILDEYKEDREDIIKKQAQGILDEINRRCEAAQQPTTQEIITLEVIETQLRKRLLKLSPIKFEIKDEHKPFVSDWSYSNMERLWQIGYEAGEKYCKSHRDSLPDREENGPNPKSA